MKKNIIYFLIVGINTINYNMVAAQQGISFIEQIDLEKIPRGTVAKYWLHLSNNGLSQPIYIPVMIAKGEKEGPTLGMTAALHGNELNGIPIIQSVFAQINPSELRGAIIGVPGLNVVSINQDRRRFPDEEDLNRNFPGKEKGNRSQQFVWNIAEKLLPHFDYLADMHTASFGRTNSLYVRADMTNDTIATMANLQDCDIILHGKGVPSTGDAIRSLRTFRAEAMLRGIPTITIEYGNPQVYQSAMIARGIRGMDNLMAWLKMLDQPIQQFEKKPIKCRKSYWIYVDEGGLLEIPVSLNQLLEKGEVIGVLKNPFGDVLKKYYAPEAGVVIGKSSNPVNMEGGRILHLGILK